VKRSEALAPLSRDHHVALEAALRLRRADEQTLDAAVARFGEFWRGHGARHFEIEEELLLPALPPGDADWAEGVERVRREHGEIRERADRLLAGATPESARELGELLNGHVRFEERELFPLAEERLPDVELAALGRAIDAAESS
jgi:hypothetical protein